MTVDPTVLQIFEDLVTKLRAHQDRCTPQIEFCKTSWVKLFESLEERLRNARSKGLPIALKRFGLGDETMWTFLVAAGYAAAGPDGVALLSRHLTGHDWAGPKEPKIWLEALPIPPRNKEGNTHYGRFNYLICHFNTNVIVYKIR